MAHGDPAHHLRTLVEVAQQLAGTFELLPLLRTIESAARAALSCDRATIFLYDPTREELHSVVATGTEEIRFPVRLGIAGEAARTRQVLHVPDAYADPRFNPEIDQLTGYRTRNLLTFPLVTPDGELMGVLQALNKPDGAFTQDDVTLAGALGCLTGIAIKRQMLLDVAAVKQRLERDLEIARQIQQQMLPNCNPKLDGFDVAGWNRPADQTGGDLYDFLPLSDCLGFMIADATGHGIGPALMVAQFRAMLRAIGLSSGGLSATASRVNELLCEDLPDGKFVTACFGALVPAASELRYMSAGQGPILLYRAAADNFEELPVTGLPMGILKDAEIPAATPVKLQPGDIFVLLTDGFFEWSRSDGEPFGEERICAVIRRHRERGCAEIIQRLYEEVQSFAAGTAQQDDLTAILIKRTD